MMYYILENGEVKKVGPVEWAHWFQKSKERFIKSDPVGEALVSTVFLGIDHNFGSGRPLLFETMVFGGKKEIQERYSTLDEAKKGHEKILKEVIKQKEGQETSENLPESVNMHLLNLMKTVVKEDVNPS